METSGTLTKGTDETPGRLQGIGGRQLVLWCLVFLALTIGIFWYQFGRIQVGDAAPHWVRPMALRL